MWFPLHGKESEWNNRSWKRKDFLQTEFHHCQLNGQLLLIVILEIQPLISVISIKVKVKTQLMRKTHSGRILQAQCEAKSILCSSYEEAQRGNRSVPALVLLTRQKFILGKGQPVLMSVKSQAFVKKQAQAMFLQILWEGTGKQGALQWPCTHDARGQRCQVSSFWCPLGFAVHIAHFLLGIDEVPEACHTSHSLSSWQ